MALKPLRERYAELELERDVLRARLGAAEVEWDPGYNFTTPEVDQVNADNVTRLSGFEPGTLVVIPPESFEPAESDEQRNAVLSYGEGTGHEVLFTYKGKARRVRVYGIQREFGLPEYVEGYDTLANEGRGGYRLFRAERIEGARLRDPEAAEPESVEEHSGHPIETDLNGVRYRRTGEQRVPDVGEWALISPRGAVRKHYSFDWVCGEREIVELVD